MVIYQAFDWLWGKYSHRNEKKTYLMGITRIANSEECSVEDTSRWLFQSRKETLFTKDREYCFWKAFRQHNILGLRPKINERPPHASQGDL